MLVCSKLVHFSMSNMSTLVYGLWARFEAYHWCGVLHYKTC